MGAVEEEMRALEMGEAASLLPRVERLEQQGGVAELRGRVVDLVGVVERAERRADEAATELAALRERMHTLTDRVSHVELDPVEELRGLRAQTAARESSWEQRMREHAERLEQLDTEVRGKSEIVAQMADRMRCVQTLDSSVSNLVNLCESGMEKHGQSIANMEVLMDEHNETIGRHSKVAKATDANVRRVQTQVLSLQKQLGSVLTCVSEPLSREPSVSRSPPSPRGRSPCPSPMFRAASPPKPPWGRATPQVRRTSASPEALPGPSEWLPVEGESRIPRARRDRDDLAPYLARTPSP